MEELAEAKVGEAREQEAPVVAAKAGEEGAAEHQAGAEVRAAPTAVEAAAREHQQARVVGPQALPGLLGAAVLVVEVRAVAATAAAMAAAARVAAARVAVATAAVGMVAVHAGEPVEMEEHLGEVAEAKELQRAPAAVQEVPEQAALEEEALEEVAKAVAE